jgi:hypothetical protein
LLPLELLEYVRDEDDRQPLPWLSSAYLLENRLMDGNGKWQWDSEEGIGSFLLIAELSGLLDNVHRRNLCENG